MSKIKDAFFTDKEPERVAEMLSQDPDYEAWSEQLEKQLQEEFGDDAESEVAEPPF